MHFFHAALVVYCLTNCPQGPGQVGPAQPLQFDVEQKACGYTTRIRSQDSEATGKTVVVCSR